MSTMRAPDTKRITWIAMLIIFELAICASARTFTDRAGNKFDATILNTTTDTVSLMIPSKGKVFKVAISKLSDSDQYYIKAYKNKTLAPKKKEAKTPQTRSAPINKLLPDKNYPREPQNPTLTRASELQTKYRLVDNYLTNWPVVVSTSQNLTINTISENKAQNRYIYHSPNYEFICDVPLPKTVVSKFALLFEATRDFCRLLPISSMKAHVPGAVSRNKILLFASQSNYVRNGAPPNSAGVFFPQTNTIMVPLTSLGVEKKGGSYTNNYNGSNKTLAHEIVHQLTDHELYQHGARGWFSEGLAEYCSATYYKSGKYTVRGNKRDIVDYVTAFGRDGNAGRSLGKEFRAPDIKDYMLQSYSSFISNGNYNYGLGALITYYFFHMEPDRRNINSFLKALKKGDTGEDALKALLNGRTFDQLESDISRAWRASGVDIHFN